MPALERPSTPTDAPSVRCRVVVLLLLVSSSAFAAELEEAGSRFAPTFNFGIVGFPALGTPPPVVGASSLRGGVRFALLPRSTDNYSLNFSTALQFGIEGIRRDHRAPLFAVALTAKVGIVGVTRGGPFLPFADL